MGFRFTEWDSNQLLWHDEPGWGSEHIDRLRHTEPVQKESGVKPTVQTRLFVRVRGPWYDETDYGKEAA